MNTATYFLRKHVSPRTLRRWGLSKDATYSYSINARDKQNLAAIHDNGEMNPDLVFDMRLNRIKVR